MIKKFVLCVVAGVVLSNCVFACDCEIVHKSVKFYDKQIIENPGDVCSFYNLANEYLLKGKIQKSLDAYDDIITLFPKEERAYLKKADIYRDYGNYDLADREYGRLIKNIPDSVTGNKKMSCIYKHISDYENALKHINKAIELTKGEEFSLFDIRADILRDMGRYDEAIEDYTKYAKSDDKYNYSAYIGLSDCYSALGDAAKEKEAYLKWRSGAHKDNPKITLVDRIKWRYSKFKSKFYTDKLY